MQHNTCFQRNQVSAVSEWTPVGGAYGKKKTIRRCLALEVVFMQMFVTSYMPKDQGKFDFSCHDPFKFLLA